MLNTAPVVITLSKGFQYGRGGGLGQRGIIVAFLLTFLSKKKTITGVEGHNR